MAAESLMTAAEARSMRPVADLTQVTARINANLRRQAPERQNFDLPMDLLPNNEMGSWCCGTLSLSAAALKAMLEEAGYQIVTDSGGHHGRGYVRIVWGDQ